MDFAIETAPLKKRGVRIAQNLLVLSNVLYAKPDGSQPYEWAALTFVRGKDTDKKKFKFNIPFNCVPQLIKALQFLLKENKDFFPASVTTCTPQPVTINN